MKAVFQENHEIDRAEWDAFVSDSTQGAVYHLSGYLDAVAPGWSATILRDDRGILAAMPLHLKRKGGYTACLQAPFSQYWGILLRSNPKPGNSYANYRDKNRQVKTILEALPRIDWFAMGFSPAFDYPQPFYWEDYSLNTRYTWVLDLHPEPEALLKEMRKSARYDIRNCQAQLAEKGDISDLLQLVEANRQAGKKLISPEETQTLERLGKWLLQSGLGWSISALIEGKAAASGLFATYKEKSIYLMSASAPEPVQGAMSWLLFQAFLKAKQSSLIFDFEGSMLEGIEQFFRGFGPEPIPYLYLEKNQIPQIFRWIKNSL